ncbi:hypothetical protein BDZ89DRAFT_1037157 [Hymenopellis radicata]|nr:hypothetical protein BDZ89DRAFT_1037157 [Hymenopellis radicata]
MNDIKTDSGGERRMAEEFDVATRRSFVLSKYFVKSCCFLTRKKNAVETPRRTSHGALARANQKSKLVTAKMVIQLVSEYFSRAQEWKLGRALRLVPLVERDWEVSRLLRHWDWEARRVISPAAEASHPRSVSMPHKLCRLSFAPTTQRFASLGTFSTTSLKIGPFNIHYRGLTIASILSGCINKGSITWLHAVYDSTPCGSVTQQHVPSHLKVYAPTRPPRSELACIETMDIDDRCGVSVANMTPGLLSRGSPLPILILVTPPCLSRTSLSIKCPGHSIVKMLQPP